MEIPHGFEVQGEELIPGFAVHALNQPLHGPRVGILFFPLLGSFKGVEYFPCARWKPLIPESVDFPGLLLEKGVFLGGGVSSPFAAQALAPGRKADFFMFAEVEGFDHIDFGLQGKKGMFSPLFAFLLEEQGLEFPGGDRGQFGHLLDEFHSNKSISNLSIVLQIHHVQFQVGFPLGPSVESESLLLLGEAVGLAVEVQLFPF